MIYINMVLVISQNPKSKKEYYPFSKIDEWENSKVLEIEFSV